VSTLDDGGKLTIRLAEPREAHVVLALMKAAFATSASELHPSSALGETIDHVEAAMASGGAILAFAPDDPDAAAPGRPVASSRFEVSRDEGWLAYERLAVHPGEQGRGIGTRLVAWLERHARELGLAEVRVTARSREPDTRPYYQALGYEITGYSERYGVPDIRTQMRKRL
jgi:GNAT superfamily N-acetyltransferase